MRKEIRISGPSKAMSLPTESKVEFVSSRLQHSSGRFRHLDRSRWINTLALGQCAAKSCSGKPKLLKSERIDRSHSRQQ